MYPVQMNSSIFLGWHGHTNLIPRYLIMVPCRVCNDETNAYLKYGSYTCLACKAFFRRHVRQLKDKRNANKAKLYRCKFDDESCIITRETRSMCSYCRYKKCIAIGMKGYLVMNEGERIERFKKIFPKKSERKTAVVVPKWVIIKSTVFFLIDRDFQYKRYSNIQGVSASSSQLV